MQISELREKVSRELLEFAWNEFAQMGVSGEIRRESPWSADPEAHLLFALQVARDDPRLFDETLDWFATNATLLSAQRLRNMSGSPADARLVEAAIAWVSGHGGRFRLSPRTVSVPSSEPLFYRTSEPPSNDEAFAAYGLVRAPVERTKKSHRPDVRRPINFGFRLRRIFGLGSRAEVLRVLLTTSRHAPPGSRPRLSAPAITFEAGFDKRNVHEALVALAEAGAVEQALVRREYFYAIDVEAWASALGIANVPLHRDWANILLGLRELHRWLAEAEQKRYSAYMLASEARQKMEEIRSSFTQAGIPLREALPAEGEDYWAIFVDLVEQVLKQYRSDLPF